MHEVTGAWLPRQHHGGHVPGDLLLLPLRHGREPLLQTQLPLATEEQQEAHLATQTQRRVRAATIVMRARPHKVTGEDIINYPLTHSHTN